MNKIEAINLIQLGIQEKEGIWADLGAGTGVFTLALLDILEKGIVYAVDKNPHVLWSLKGSELVELKVEEANFEKDMPLPVLDGIIMANALHYSSDPLKTLSNIMRYLKPGGTFILIEYEVERAISRWVPYPINFQKFKELAPKVNLSPPVELGRVPSKYGYDYIYAASTSLVG